LYGIYIFNDIGDTAAWMDALGPPTAPRAGRRAPAVAWSPPAAQRAGAHAPAMATRRWPLFFHKLVDAPVAEVRRIDGPRAVHGDVMWDINLAGNLAERTQHTQNLAVQIHLDNA